MLYMRIVRKIKFSIKKFLEAMSPRLLLKFRILARRGFELELEWLPRFCDKDRESIDIGAHWGLYSFFMVRYSKKVHAFEPNPDVFNVLKRGLGSKIKTWHYALSDYSGECELRIPEDEPGGATIESLNLLEEAQDYTNIKKTLVPVKRLDEFGFNNIGFIKIDVEGHEESVVSGALETIKRSRPNFLIEIEERHHTRALEKVALILKELNYLGFFLKDGRMRSLVDFDQDRHQSFENINYFGKNGEYINNFIFLHREIVKKNKNWFKCAS